MTIPRETDVPLTCPCCEARLSFYEVEKTRHGNLLTVVARFACGAQWDRTDDATFGALGTTQFKIYSRGNWRRAVNCGNAEDMLMKMKERPAS